MHVHPSVVENTGLKPQLIQLLPRHGEDLIVTPFAQVFMLLSSCFMATTTWCKNLSDLGKFAQRSQQLHHPHQCAPHAQVEPHPGDHHSLLIARSRRPSLASGPAFTHLSRSEPSDENYVKVRRDNWGLKMKCCSASGRNPGGAWLVPGPARDDPDPPVRLRHGLQQGEQHDAVDTGVDMDTERCFRGNWMEVDVLIHIHGVLR